MTHLTSKIRLVLIALALAMSGSGPMASSFADVIRVVPQALPVPLHRQDPGSTQPIELDTKIEASAVEPIGNGRYVMVAHDKASEFYLVETATGRIVSEPIVSDALPPTTAVGPKYEAMARDSHDHFFVMGSHSGKTAEEKSQKAHLIRFGTTHRTRIPEIDPASVRRYNAFPGLVAALSKESPEVGKLKVEGLAIIEKAAANGKPATTDVVVGLREPGDLVRVFTAPITEDQAAEQPLAFEKLFAFDAGLREGVQAQLTSLTYVPAWKGFFILTATESAENTFHGNTLWFLAEDQIPKTGLAKPDRIHDFEVAMKAEGVADLADDAGPSRTRLRLVVVFDNDAKSTHMPSRIQTLLVTRRDDRN